MTAFAIILASFLHLPSASSFAFAPSPLPSLLGRIPLLTPRRLPPTAMFSANDYDTSETTPPETVVIAGAGVVGTSTAYYLAVDHGVRSILVDPTGRIAPAASGKAGGFLALDWNDMSPLRKLARRSFALHESLASDENLGERSIMYRRLTCSAVSVDPQRAGRRPGGKKLEGVEWAEDGDDGGGTSSSAVLGSRALGDERTIAQVHPKMLCDALWEEAKRRRGCALVEGEVAEPVYRERDDDDGDDGKREEGHKKLAGVRLSNGEIIECDAVLFACGPWTSSHNNLMTGVKYHSAVIPTPRVLTQSVFFDGCGDPEVYPRPDSTAYCTGFPDPAVRVKEHPGEEEVRPEAIQRILNAVRSASGEAGVLGAKPVVEQACYLPTTPDGLPMMGPLPGTAGRSCYVAAGHGCWGILLGPGTGETMASLIATGKSTRHVDLRPFDPSRFG